MASKPLKKKMKIEESSEEEEFQVKEEEKEAAAAAEADDDDDIDEGDNVPKAQKNDSGEIFFDLAHSKRVTVRTFKGKLLVDIREVRTYSIIIMRNTTPS